MCLKLRRYVYDHIILRNNLSASINIYINSIRASISKTLHLFRWFQHTPITQANLSIKLFMFTLTCIYLDCYLKFIPLPYGGIHKKDIIEIYKCMENKQDLLFDYCTLLANVILLICSFLVSSLSPVLRVTMADSYFLFLFFLFIC